MVDSNPKNSTKTQADTDASEDWDWVENWDWLWSGIFYATVLFSWGIIWVDGINISTSQLWTSIGLTIFLGLWHWLWAIRWPRQWDKMRDHQSRWMLPYIGGFFIALAILATISPIFYFMLFGLYSQTFRWLPVFWAMPSAIIITLYVIYSLTIEKGGSSWWTNTNALIFFILTITGGLAALWITSIIEQSRERKALISHLQQTQAELASAEREAGKLAERQRLAHEIHDTLAQGFISVITHLEAAEQAISTDQVAVERHLDRARQTARENLAEARRVVQDLRPEPLETTASLPQALDRAVSQWATETEIEAQVIVTGETRRLHPQIEVTILRATQEALTNVGKHARMASQVDVTLSYMDDLVVLDVQDNGNGIQTSQASTLISGGFGLTAMRERAAQLNGDLLVESEPGEGTTLVLQIPLTGSTA